MAGEHKLVIDRGAVHDILQCFLDAEAATILHARHLRESYRPLPILLAKSSRDYFPVALLPDLEVLDQGGLPEVQGPRRLELALAAGGDDSPVDVSIAQRATLGSDSNGDISRHIFQCIGKWASKFTSQWT